MKKHMIAIMLSLAMAVGCISSSSVFAAETAGETPAAESPVEETAGEELAVPEGTEEELAVPEGTDGELPVPETTGEELPVPETTGEETALQEEQEGLTEAAEPDQTEGVQEEDIGIIETDESAQLEENREAESAGGDDVEQAIWTEGNKTLTFYYGPLFSAGDSFRGETVTNVWSGWGITHSSIIRSPAWNSTVNTTATNVVFDTSFKEVRPTSLYKWFYGFSELEVLDFTNLDTSDVTTMGFMFDRCSITSLDLSGFDTSNVKNMMGMFYYCTNLTDLNISGFDTSNVATMENMFQDCESLTSLDLSGFDTSKVTYYSDMFKDCWKLGVIYCANNATQWNFDDSVGIFSSCFALTGIDENYEVSYLSSRDMRASMAKSAYLGGYFTPKISTFRLGKTTRGDMFNLANNVKVTWKEVPGARYYKVYREGVTDPKETRKDPVIVTTGLVGWDKDPGLTNGHAYRYKIVASLTGKGNDSGNSMQSYSKLMYRLKTVVIRSVKNTAPGKVTVKYDKTASGDSYVLQYSEQQDMVGAKTKVVLGASNTSYVIGGLKKGRTYYISIRVRKKVGGIDYYTTFGVPKKVTITK